MELPLIGICQSRASVLSCFDLFCSFSRSTRTTQRIPLSAALTGPRSFFGVLFLSAQLYRFFHPFVFTLPPPFAVEPYRREHPQTVLPCRLRPDSGEASLHFTERKQAILTSHDSEQSSPKTSLLRIIVPLYWGTRGSNPPCFFLPAFTRLSRGSCLVSALG